MSVGLMDLKKFNQINLKTQLLIFGYIRNVQGLFPKNIVCYNIPIFINHICGLYIFHFENWDEKNAGNSYIINKIDKILTQSVTNWNSALMKNIVSDGKHEWLFQLIEYNDNFSDNVCIGITKKDVPKNINTWIGNEINSAYAYLANFPCLNSYSKDEWIKEYGVKCKKNDIIGIHLDLNNLHISFSTNGVNHGKAFDVDKSEYRVGVNIRKAKTALKLLSYQRLY